MEKKYWRGRSAIGANGYVFHVGHNPNDGQKWKALAAWPHVLVARTMASFLYGVQVTDRSYLQRYLYFWWPSLFSRAIYRRAEPRVLTQ